MPATEYGVFDDEEGCIEHGFTVYRLAELTANRWREGGIPNAYAAEMCPDHEEQPHEGCDVCESEEL